MYVKAIKGLDGMVCGIVQVQVVLLFLLLLVDAANSYAQASAQEGAEDARLHGAQKVFVLWQAINHRV